MCGIAGFWGSGNFLPDNKLIKNCSKLMIRRGPDNVTYKKFSNKEKSFLFMHSRLSIIDPVENSNQPMEDDNGILIFNGEIYNYIELKKDLIIKGYKFKTNSDTEVLLKMLSHYKEKALDLLDGMWAFAYYSKVNKILYLSKDRFGEKPLYIYKNKKNIYFGSNINYILSLNNLRPEINYTKIHDYLYSGFRSIDLKDDTFFKDIQNVKPNTIITISKNGFQEKKYWNYQNVKIDNSLSYDEAKELVKITFLDSLKKRLRSDFPISCLLSGGVDSNAIVASSAKMFNSNMKCYSIESQDLHYDESENINHVKKKLDLNHVYVNPKADLSENGIDNMIKDAAYPISSISMLLFYYLNKAISNDKIRVVQSGIGADELFAGYYAHSMYYLYSSQNTLGFKNIHSDWEKFVKPTVRNRSLYDFDYYKKSVETQEHVFVANDTFPNIFIKDKKIQIPKNKYFKDYFKNQLANDMFLHNVPTQLRDCDAMSMYFGIESRSPFLSKDLFELAFSLNNRFLIKNGYGKRIFRDAMKGIVSQKILKSKNKVGFNISMQTLYDIKSNNFKDKIFQNEKIKKIINIKNIEKVLKKDKITNPESHILFSLLNIGIFLNEYG